MAEERIITVGYVELAGSGGSSNKRKVNESSELEKSSRTIYKDKHGAYSEQFTKHHKAEEFVDKHSGTLGFKEQVTYKSTHKVNDEVQGSTTEYETQVKFKKTVYPNKSASKCNYNKAIYYD